MLLAGERHYLSRSGADRESGQVGAADGGAPQQSRGRSEQQEDPNLRTSKSLEAEFEQAA